MDSARFLCFSLSLSLLLFCWFLLFFWGSPALGDLWNWSRLSAPKRRRSFAHTHTHTQVKTKIIIKTKVEKENKMKNPTRKLSQWGSRIEDLCLVRSRLEFSAGRGLFFGQKKKTEIQYNFRRQPQNPKKRNARSKATIRRRRSCRRRLPQFASNFRSWDVP